ncbi:sugar phosphate isomerase/epimerase [Falsarthrobacter nasiphocae]|uniref:Sugar phosphate isomerase/epimerase n=1 Tax=Falsarthrobacter nasiphocae TaxID=189863 RepID=A0AAE3YFS7_9MICC|nr:sugar phosphate isomerase/epimerase [Falsarthrobacter nasiphocae]MDR6892365.1 sugar phosphate isomerase/epimerase [Falsarthrobacter nasiphocae]
MSIPVGLSTSCLFPRGVADTFSTAADLGYDGVEVMVTHLLDSREVARLQRLSARHNQPILAIHAPTLFWTQQVWGSPWQKMERSAQLAAELGAASVVAHPPFRWQKQYASEFVEGVRALEARHGVEVCVENMYPWRVRGREVEMYLPHWDPIPHAYDHITWDFSHAALAHVNSLEAFRELGPRLRHIHVTDGFAGGTADSHLLPGDGDQPVAEALEFAASSGFSGIAVVEVGTRKATAAGEREEWLARSLEFTRRHLGQS